MQLTPVDDDPFGPVDWSNPRIISAGTPMQAFGSTVVQPQAQPPVAAPPPYDFGAGVANELGSGISAAAKGAWNYLTTKHDNPLNYPTQAMGALKLLQEAQKIPGQTVQPYVDIAHGAYTDNFDELSQGVFGTALNAVPIGKIAGGLAGMTGLAGKSSILAAMLTPASRTWSREAAATAKDMLASGASADEIAKATGLAVNAEGKLFGHIPEDNTIWNLDPNKGQQTWGDVYQNPDFTKAYPQLLDKPFEWRYDSNPGNMGTYNTSTAKITLNPNGYGSNLVPQHVETMAHEINHGVQSISGMQNGANPQNSDLINFAQNLQVGKNDLAQKMSDKLAQEQSDYLSAQLKANPNLSIMQAYANFEKQNPEKFEFLDKLQNLDFNNFRVYQKTAGEAESRGFGEDAKNAYMRQVNSAWEQTLPPNMSDFDKAVMEYQRPYKNVPPQQPVNKIISTPNEIQTGDPRSSALNLILTGRSPPLNALELGLTDPKKGIDVINSLLSTK